MRSLVLLLSVVVGCGDAELGPDADVDGAPSDVRGHWATSWSCDLGCQGEPARPALTYSGQLEVDEVLVRWSDLDCPECNADHQVVRLELDCVDVAGDANGRSSYRLCAAAELSGVVEWTSPFTGDVTRWTVRGVR
jgi:hypothetical protein